MIDVSSLVPSLVAGGVTGLIAWGTIRTELKWLRRDTDMAHTRLDQLEAEIQDMARERRTPRIPARVRAAAARGARR